MSAVQDPRRSAFATSIPARPTYMGLRLTAFAPVVTRTEAPAGSNGSNVVPWRRNCRAAAAASAPETAAVALAAAARAAEGGCAPLVSARWARAAENARAGGGGRIILVTCHVLRPDVECKGARTPPGRYCPTVIIWINGTFGAGKTTTGTLLAQRNPRLRVFDPEWVGYMLMNNLADRDVTDFQQLESWRRLTPLVADELVRFTGHELVVIQTVLDEDYWRELQSGLSALGHEVVHVVLEADESVMRKRIAADENEPAAAHWRLDHLATYATARTWLTASADLVLDTTDLTPDDAADQVWKLVADRVHEN